MVNNVATLRDLMVDLDKVLSLCEHWLKDLIHAWLAFSERCVRVAEYL